MSQYAGPVTGFGGHNRITPDLILVLFILLVVILCGMRCF
ncbi:sporulation protein YjcZ [Paenibacillus spongiae]|uniref:Sporulation protein YjcZ n=1 Tax=Paenibacillus spongiae TaxID=2909671 RepID=A0ABY5SCM6_9BACL|nr:sporulation protein YjcZ [Paenibacillus spongiae]UVI31716.1 sporulation protein YjcZ [Paenibacillus spongiae]